LLIKRIFATEIEEQGCHAPQKMANFAPIAQPNRIYDPARPLYCAPMNYLKNSRLYTDGFPAVGLLFLRLFVGYAMASHGLGKIANPFGWMDKPGAPSSVPDVLQALAAVSEFFGGIAIIFGAFFPLACLGVMCTMFVAALSHLNRGDALIEGGGENAALYFFVSLALFMTGPGMLSFDYFLFGRKKSAATTS
jgi:putative oxidoreductase